MVTSNPKKPITVVAMKSKLGEITIIVHCVVVALHSRPVVVRWWLLCLRGQRGVVDDGGGENTNESRDTHKDDDDILFFSIFPF